MFKYLSGERVELGDVVKASVFNSNEEAIVDCIFIPYSDEAYGICYETGGVMFRVGIEQSLLLVTKLDEDFELLHRAKR